MKIHIRSFQMGGNLLAPIYQPVQVTPTATRAQYAINLLGGSSNQTASKNSKSDGSITEKDLFTGLYKTIAEQGLQSDTQVIISKLQQELFNNNLLDPFGDTSDLSTKYLKALNYVNQAKQNQKLYDNTYQEAVSSGSIKEAAVTSTGQVIVKDKDNNITAIDIEKYRENPKNYIVMTNGNLLAERMNNPQQAFRNNLLEIVQNGTSMKEINTIIKDITAKLAKDVNELQGYTSVQQGRIQKGIALLQAAAQKYGETAVTDMLSVDGLYEIGITSEDQVKQVRQAIDSIYQELSPQQKALLQLKSADGTRKGAYNLIASIVSTGADTTFKFKADLESGVDAQGNKVGKAAQGSSEDKGDNTTSSLITNIQRSMGGNEQTYVMNPGGKAQLQVTGTHYGQIYDPKGDPIGKTSLGNMLQESMLQSVTDVNTIYFGDQKVSPDKLKDITYENQGATKVLLPAVKSESLWRPNFEYFEAYEKAAAKVRAQGLNPNDESNPAAMKALAEALKAEGLYDLIDRTTDLPDTRLVRPFLVTTGYATSLSGIQDSDYIDEVSDSQVIDSVIDTLSEKGKDGKVKKYSFDKSSVWNPFDMFGLASGFYDHIYKGTVYIPINTNELAGATASGQKIKSFYAEQREKEYQNSWKRINSGQTNSDVIK